MDNEPIYIYGKALSMDNKPIYIYGKALSMDKKRNNIYECLLSIVNEGLYVFKRPSSNGGASVYVGLSVLTADSPLQAASGRASSDGCVPYFPERSLSAADADLDTTPASMMIA